LWKKAGTRNHGFDDIPTCVMHLPASLICVLFILARHFFQQQVAFAIHNTKLREAAKWAESRRIAELFPIDWNSESSELQRSNNRDEQHLTKTKAPFRTRSPVRNQDLIHSLYPEIALSQCAGPHIKC
jgi:hypothetical protein